MEFIDLDFKIILAMINKNKMIYFNTVYIF